LHHHPATVLSVIDSCDQSFIAFIANLGGQQHRMLHKIPQLANSKAAA
jgi:hypothetical protein